MSSYINEEELEQLLDQAGVKYTEDGLNQILIYFQKLSQALNKLTDEEKTAFSISIPTPPVDGPFGYRMEYKYLATLIDPALKNNLTLDGKNVIFLTENNPYIDYGTYFSR